MMKNKLIVKGRNTSKIVAIDIEKTRPGLGKKPKAEIVEIGMVKLGISHKDWGDALSIQDHFSTLIDPNISINNTFDHGITDEDVKGAPTFSNVAEQIVSFLNGSHIVISHNCSAEYILFEELAQLGYESQIRFLDTKEMAKVIDSCCFHKETKCFTLGALTAKFRCSPCNPHRALDDAIACANLYIVYRFLARRLNYIGWEGFKELEAQKKIFMYEKVYQIPNNKKIKAVSSGKMKCRIPQNELEIYKRLYWK
jgi:DNA polymerase III epsilon subunit-like protein